LISLVPQLAGDTIREETVHRFTQNISCLAHRNPSPRAMMPRKISRVPPRMVKDGE
jgi:hypothetical protein